MAKNVTVNNNLDFENTYKVIEDHTTKYCIKRASKKLNNKCLNWVHKSFKTGDTVKSLLIDNDEIVVIEKGKGLKIPLSKVQLVKLNDFGMEMEKTTSSPIKTGIRLSYNEIYLLIFLGLLLIGTGILTFRGVKKIKAEHLQIEN